MDNFDVKDVRFQATRLSIAAHVFKVPDEVLDKYLDSFKGVGQAIWVYNKSFPQNWMDAREKGDDACALYRTLVRLANIQYYLRVLQQKKSSDLKQVHHNIKFLCKPTTTNVCFLRKVCKNDPSNTERKRMKKQIRNGEALVKESPWKRLKVV
ncbi:hypothetical protein T484DRAFT_1757348 [Baffinella frigidus]|nr:hypothetical protein T484DRAFT_1757348 [Cryptophyta sp. CCMP2293]